MYKGATIAQDRIERIKRDWVDEVLSQKAETVRASNDDLSTVLAESCVECFVCPPLRRATDAI